MQSSPYASVIVKVPVPPLSDPVTDPVQASKVKTVELTLILRPGPNPDPHGDKTTVPLLVGTVMLG